MDAAQQNVRYHKTVNLGNVRTVVILGDPGAERREEASRPGNLPPGLRGLVLIKRPAYCVKKFWFLPYRRGNQLLTLHIRCTVMFSPFRTKETQCHFHWPNLTL